MREAQRIILHDAALDLFVDDASGLTLPLHAERFSPSFELAEWLNWFMVNTYTKRVSSPDDLYFWRMYQMPEVDVTRILAAVTAPNVLEMEVTFRGDDGATWTQRGTYCGSFQVWWKDGNA